MIVFRHTYGVFMFYLGWSGLVVVTSAIHYLNSFISEVIFCVAGDAKPYSLTRSLAHSLTHSLWMTSSLHFYNVEGPELEWLTVDHAVSMVVE